MPTRSAARNRGSSSSMLETNESVLNRPMLPRRRSLKDGWSLRSTGLAMSQRFRRLTSQRTLFVFLVLLGLWTTLRLTFCALTASMNHLSRWSFCLSARDRHWLGLDGESLDPLSPYVIAPGPRSLHLASCSKDVLVLVRTSKKTYPQRAPTIIRTWLRDFPRERVFFVSPDPLPDYGANVLVLDILRTDIYYGHTYSPDAVGTPVFLELMRKFGANYLLIVDDDTYVFGENFCNTLHELEVSRRSEFLYSGFSFCMDAPYGAYMHMRCITPPEATRPLPTHKPCTVGFAYGGGGVVMNRALVKALASVANECWNQTYCIRGGSLRTWWCMYFHPEIFKGKEQQMDMHWSFMPNRPSYYLQTMGKRGLVQGVPHNSSYRPASFHHVEGAEAYWLYSLRLAPDPQRLALPADWRGQVTMAHIFGHPPPWAGDCEGSFFRKAQKEAEDRMKRIREKLANAQDKGQSQRKV
ncbi:hypothetical protein CCYA_CCYA14G3772 [Cyanidiococcus yangmingshanensis]|nr:hypothetical protein CCYA_CCYA14G3772 [Cyanidiococcus yangmingshanensis]